MITESSNSWNLHVSNVLTWKHVNLSFVSWQGDMELALESYDVCTGLLQSRPKSPEGKHYTINLPNLRVDSAISLEEVSFSSINLTLISNISL